MELSPESAGEPFFVVSRMVQMAGMARSTLGESVVAVTERVGAKAYLGLQQDWAWVSETHDYRCLVGQ